jgi:hypothetical protein
MSVVFVLTVQPTSGVQMAYTVPPLPPSAHFFSNKNFFSKKMEKNFFSNKNGLTSGLTRG